MPDFASSVSSTFSDSCPTYIVAEGTTEDAFDNVVLSDKIIKERSAIGKMDIPTSNQFKDQFNAKYMSQVFPSTLNYSCGGANYPDFWATLEDDSLTADFVRDVWRRCNGEAMLLESHLLDFNEDVYGQYVRVELLHQLRDERIFENIEGLTKQMEKDVEDARQFFKNRNSNQAAN